MLAPLLGNQFLALVQPIFCQRCENCEMLLKNGGPAVR